MIDSVIDDVNWLYVCDIHSINELEVEPGSAYYFRVPDDLNEPWLVYRRRYQKLRDIEE